MHLRESKSLKQTEMKAVLGIERTTWNNYENGVSKPNVDGLTAIAKFFGISETDLLHTDLSVKGNLKNIARESKKSPEGNPKGNGKGNLLPIKGANELPDPVYFRMPQVVTVDSQGNDNVVMVPVKARAGYLSGYGDPKYIETLPAYRLPGFNNGTFRLFEVQGNSMTKGRGGIHDRDIIIGRAVENLQDVRDDRVHVVVTRDQGVVVKRVYNRIKTDARLILQSDNYRERDQYPTIVCEPEDVVEVWYAVALITRHMPGNDDQYTRMIDLEGKFTLLQDEFRKLAAKFT